VVVFTQCGQEGGGGGTTEQAEVPVFNVRRAECAQNNISTF
jgi:hypothetical protein